MEYTAGQKQAINDHPAGNILVSASAGSGKTRVLVDRIIKMVTEDGVNIDQLLVVTFTNAAAKEMKERLQTALRERYQEADNPQLKQHLLRQIQKVPVADITTIDAYCQKLVGRYYYLLGLDPNFRLLTDSTEVSLLQEQIWADLREQLYADDQDGEFAALTDNFSNDRSDDGLTNLVIEMYRFANVNEDPLAWLNQAAAFYQLDQSELTASSLFREYILPELLVTSEKMQLAANQISRNAQAQELDKDEELGQKITELLTDLQAQFEDGDWNQIRMTLNQIKLPSATLRNAEPEQKAVHKRNLELRKEVDTSLKTLQNDYFEFDEAKTVALTAAAAHRVELLSQVVGQFAKAYDQAKRQRHVMEFIDVEHAAYDILTLDSPQGQQVLAKLQSQYVEIMVDEYQDNNQLQEAILSRLANPSRGNRFMVGDVKQSIYRFRLSDPTMFIAKQTAYQQDETADELINLAENFRSMANIDRFTNLIFKQVMDRQVGEVDYTGAAELQFGATYYPEDVQLSADLLLYNATGSTEPELEVNASFVPEDGANGQAEIMAQRIKRLIDDQTLIYDRHTQQMRPIRYQDIAIISATHNNDLTISDVFGKYDIPAMIGQARSYFKTTEIQIMMALLSVIDNPYQDIPLVAVLRSPIVGLDENQLAYVRINQKTGNYYQALLDFHDQFNESEATEFGRRVYEQLDRFLTQLTGFKDLAQQNDLVALIWAIYDQTGFLDYVGGMPAGYQRQANLHALYQRAAQYEQTSFKGLFAFVQFIERMQQRDDDLGQASVQTGDDAVTVTTIHGSKGLEFPVVFLSDVGKRFNQQDLNQRYVLNDHLGVGITYFNPQTREVSTTLQRQVIKNRSKRATVSEEMRKLYVALTRAEQKLYLVGNLKKAPESVSELVTDWQGKTDGQQLLLPEALRENANSYLDWIGPAISRQPDVTATYGDSLGGSLLAADQTKIKISLIGDQDLAAQQPAKLTGSQRAREWMNKMTPQPDLTVAPKDQDNPPTDQATIDAVMDFNYPYQAATKTTAYQAVSEVKRLFDDPDNIELGSYQLLDVDQIGAARPAFSAPLGRPRFLQEQQAPKATEVGTATHLVLQQLALNSVPTATDIAAVIHKLVADNVLDANVAKLIDSASLLQFYQSDLGQLIVKHADQTQREVPFSLLMPAEQIFTGFDNDGDQSVLIHGIIDGYTIADDEVVLFDYKTDHVTPKNATAQIVDRYRGQLELYGLALAHVLDRPVSHKYLYLLATGETVEVK